MAAKHTAGIRVLQQPAEHQRNGRLCVQRGQRSETARRRASGAWLSRADLHTVPKKILDVKTVITPRWKGQLVIFNGKSIVFRHTLVLIKYFGTARKSALVTI